MRQGTNGRGVSRRCGVGGGRGAGRSRGRRRRRVDRPGASPAAVERFPGGRRVVGAALSFDLPEDAVAPPEDVFSMLGGAPEECWPGRSGRQQGRADGLLHRPRREGAPKRISALTGTGPHRDRPSQRPALTRTGCAPAASPGRWDQLGSACHLSAACRPRSVPPGRCGRGRSGAPA